MRLNKIVGTTALVLGLAFWAAAQAPASPSTNDGTQNGAQTGRGFRRGPGGPGFGREFDKLNLTDAQREQLRSQMQTQRQQLDALRSDQSLTPEQRRAKAEELRKQGHEQFLSALTPEQRQQLQNERQQAREHFGNGDFGPLAGLNLTDQQKAQLKAQREQTEQQAQAIRNNSSLTEEQKREQMRTLHQNAMQQFRSALTPEQQQQLEQQMSERRKHGHGPGGGARRGAGKRPA